MKKERLCLDCGRYFKLSTSEYRSYSTRKKSLPSHCPSCREARYIHEHPAKTNIETHKGENIMTDFELSKLITESLDRVKSASIGSSFVMKKGTYAKLSAIEKIIGSYHGTYSSEFDAAINSLDIRIEGYVFDSTTDNLKALFSIPDLFVIDALSDGKICIEMKLQNACIKLEG